MPSRRITGPTKTTPLARADVSRQVGALGHWIASHPDPDLGDNILKEAKYRAKRLTDLLLQWMVEQPYQQ